MPLRLMLLLLQKCDRDSIAISKSYWFVFHRYHKAVGRTKPFNVQQVDDEDPQGSHSQVPTGPAPRCVRERVRENPTASGNLRRRPAPSLDSATSDTLPTRPRRWALPGRTPCRYVARWLRSRPGFPSCHIHVVRAESNGTYQRLRCRRQRCCLKNRFHQRSHRQIRRTAI